MGRGEGTGRSEKDGEKNGNGTDLIDTLIEKRGREEEAKIDFQL